MFRRVAVRGAATRGRGSRGERVLRFTREVVMTLRSSLTWTCALAAVAAMTVEARREARSDAGAALTHRHHRRRSTARWSPITRMALSMSPTQTVLWDQNRVLGQAVGLRVGVAGEAGSRA